MFRDFKQPLKITGIYVVIGLLWIYFSTIIMNSFFDLETERQLTDIQAAVRLSFIVLSAVLLFTLIYRFNSTIQQKYNEYSKLFHDNPNPMWIYSTETFHFLAVNDAALKEYGYTREEFLTMTIKDIRPAEDLPRLELAVRNRQNNFYSSGIWRHLKKDGERIWVEISSTPMEWEGKKAELILSNNVTKRVEYEKDLHDLNETLEEKIRHRTQQIESANHELTALNEELTASNEELLSTNDQLEAARDKILEQADALVRQSREKLNRIVSTIKDMVWSGTAKGNRLHFDFVNQAVEEIYGYSLTHFYQHENLWHECIPDEDKSKIDLALRDLYTTGYVESEHRITDRQGKIKFISVRMWSHRTNEPGVFRIDGITADISLRKAQEEEKARLIQQLVHQNTDLIQFSFIASHNLRGPVATLLGLLNLIQEEKITDPDLGMLLQYVQGTVGKLDEVTRDLTKILQIRSHDYQAREVVYLPELLARVKESLAPQIDANHAEIVENFRSAPRLYTIRNYLQSIFYQLISNAIKFQMRDRRPYIEIMSFKDAQGIRIAFSDNGLGLDLDLFREKIFSLYQRFHTHVEGKGFGLYLVKTQMEALHGSITVESAPGRGTTFTLHFPAESKPA